MMMYNRFLGTLLSQQLLSNKISSFLEEQFLFDSGNIPDCVHFPRPTSSFALDSLSHAVAVVDSFPQWKMNFPHISKQSTAFLSWHS
jgi:hypothetical protein